MHVFHIITTTNMSTMKLDSNYYNVCMYFVCMYICMYNACLYLCVCVQDARYVKQLSMSSTHSDYIGMDKQHTHSVPLILDSTAYLHRLSNV